jgi:plasmid stabilization system protein ParE
MSFVVRRLRLAEEDALEAALWYEEREPGLGEEFLTEVESSVQSLARDALLYRVRFQDVRRAPVRRFKYYGVYYMVVEREVWVVAVYHGRRHPKNLEERRGLI